MSRGHLARLRFPAEMEARFAAMSAEQRLKHFVISGAIALLVYNGFLMADWFLMPDTFMLDVSLRIVVTMTYCAGVLWLLHTKRAFCLRQPVWFAEGLIVGTGILASATLAVVALGVSVRISRLEWALLALAIGAVWAAEALNTGIEFVVDLVSPDHHELAGKAKDVAAAGVLLASLSAEIGRAHV